MTLAGPSATQLALVAMLPPAMMNIVIGMRPELSPGDALTPQQLGAMVGLYTLGLGLGQPLSGLVSDRLGRRPVLLAGLILAAVGAFLAALAESAGVLMVGRLATGLGLAAALVVPRATLRDVYEGAQLQRSMAILAMVFALAPAVTPPLAWAVGAVTSWRFVLGAGAALVLCVLLLAFAYFPETQRAAARWPNLATWLALARHRGVRRVVLAFAAAAAPFFILATAAPAALRESLELTDAQVALTMGATFLGFGAGNQWVRLRASQPGTSHMALGLVLVVCAAGLLACTLAWPSHLLWLAALGLYALGHGIVFPAAFSLVLQAMPAQAGLAVAAMGTVHMTTGALAAFLTGALPLAAHAASAVMVSGAVLAAAALWWAGDSSRR